MKNEHAEKLKRSIRKIKNKYNQATNINSIANLIERKNQAYSELMNHKLLIASEKRTKYISKDEMETVMDDVCAICMDSHAVKDTIITNCKHQFGKQCFSDWVWNCVNHLNTVSCPMCKKNKGLRSIRFEDEATKDNATNPVEAEA